MYYLEIPTLTKVDVTKFFNKFDQLFDQEETLKIQQRINQKNKLTINEPQKEVKDAQFSEIEIINKAEPDFFKMTTQEQIYHLKTNQINILKLIKEKFKK